MKKLSGIGTISRNRLSKVLRASKGTITVELASQVINIPRSEASKILSEWSSQGWIYRVKRGTYISIPLESSDPEPAIEDPWIIAREVFNPCYIGGWSAAEYWDLTEQIFQSVCIITTRSKRSKSVKLGGVEFYIKSISSNLFSGYQLVWRGQIQVNVSDPSRMIIDMLDDLKLGGGIRPIYEILVNYMKSSHKDTARLFQYAQLIGNRTVFKRLGFLLERYYPDEVDMINQCLDQISSGYSKLDPDLDADNIITKWKLWVPKSWAGKV
jgi:predicted transcriptional regulator of viral defense system